MIKLCALVFLLALSLAAGAQTPPDPVAEIRATIAQQENAWNHGDIDGFMNGYARSDKTLFISGDEVTRGWETVRARYAQKYGSVAKMGTLQFSDLEVNPISADAAVVTGRWELAVENSHPHGRFTLIFRRLDEGWLIVQDHTSSASE